jgi:ribosomal protein S18 acetylase RimI-like enzyme
MQSLASARLRAGDSLMHPGDVAWALGWFPKTQEHLAASVSLWHRGDELVAWSLLDRGELWTCTAPNDVEADHAIEAAAAEMPGPLSRVARDDDDDALARLRASGYARAPDEDMRVFVRSLDDVDLAAVDERVGPVDPNDDLAPRLRVTHTAFDVAMPFDAYVEAYASFVQTPAYPRGWDLVAWTSDGEPAAATIAWPDGDSLVGNFEPVAAHPAHRRRGFATVVMREGMRRLRAAGMTRSIVRTPVSNTGATALYRSVGFEDAGLELVLRRS